MIPNPFVYGWVDVPYMIFGVVFHVLFWPLRRWGKDDRA